MKLVPKTKKAREVIKRAGTDQWQIIRSDESLIFFDGDAGHMVEPMLVSTADAFKLARWIRAFNDRDFEIQND